MALTIYILSIILFFYMLRKHHIKDTDWAIKEEVVGFIFLMGFVPVLNFVFGIFLWLEEIRNRLRTQ